MPAISLDPNFKEFLGLLNSAKVRYLLLGGYAVNYHGYHRFTGDIDIWIAMGEENADRLAGALRDFRLIDDTVPPATFLQPGKVFQFGRVPVRIDLLTGPSGVQFEDCYGRRVEATLAGVTVPVISLRDLRVNKLASGRTKDLADLEGLPTDFPAAARTKRKPHRKPGR